jgi:hypothetical protein
LLIVNALGALYPFGWFVVVAKKCSIPGRSRHPWTKTGFTEKWAGGVRDPAVNVMKSYISFPSLRQSPSAPGQSTSRALLVKVTDSRGVRASGTRIAWRNAGERSCDETTQSGITLDKGPIMALDFHQQTEVERIQSKLAEFLPAQEARAIASVATGI